MKAGALKGHGAMLCANMMWGLMSPVAKFVMVGGALTPLVVTDLRVIGAMVLFWIVSFFQKQEYVPPKDLMKLFAASLLAIVFNQGCFVFGVGLSSPVDASIITTSMPLIAMVLAAVYLKVPITGRKIIFYGFWQTRRRYGLIGAYKCVCEGVNDRVNHNPSPLCLCFTVRYASFEGVEVKFKKPPLG